MAKDISAPLARTARLLDLVPYLNAHQGISIEELANAFEVSSSQIISDLTTLWMCGLPGYTPLELMDLDFDSGFVTIRNAPTLSKPRRITFEEGVALLLGLDLIKNSIPQDRHDLLLIASNLAIKLIQKTGVPNSVKISDSHSLTVSSVISSALHKNTGLQIRYHSIYNDLITTRRVSPIELYEADGQHYLRAFCSQAQDFREFRIDRILEVQEIEFETHLVPSNHNTSKIQFSIKVQQPSRDSVERFAISTEIEIAQLASYSNQWIERSVMAGGGEVELLAPVDIRHEISRKAQLILDRYQESVNRL